MWATWERAFRAGAFTSSHNRSCAVRSHESARLTWISPARRSSIATTTMSRSATVPTRCSQSGPCAIGVDCFSTIHGRWARVVSHSWRSERSRNPSAASSSAMTSASWAAAASRRHSCRARSSERARSVPSGMLTRHPESPGRCAPEAGLQSAYEWWWSASPGATAPSGSGELTRTAGTSGRSPTARATRSPSNAAPPRCGSTRSSTGARAASGTRARFQSIVTSPATTTDGPAAASDCVSDAAMPVSSPDASLPS